MALSIESSLSAVNTFTNQLSWSFTNTAGNLVIVGAMAGDPTSADRAVSSITYAAAAFSDFATTNSDDGNFLRASAKYKGTPATGANTVVVNFGGTCEGAAAGITSAIGADTSTFGAVVTGSSTTDKNATVTVSIGAGEIGIAFVASDANTITENGTLQWEREGVNSDTSHGGQTSTSTGSTAMNWTGGVGDNGWAAWGTVIKVAGGGGASRRRVRLCN